MKKIKLFLAAAALMIGGGNLLAQTDVTNLLVNPSFEYSAEEVAYTATTELNNGQAIYGWTGATISNNNKNIQVTNSAPNTGFGTTTASDGSFFYFIRQGWENKTSSIGQDVTLPAGRYYVTVDYKEAEAHDNGNFLDSKVGITVKKGNDNLSVLSTGGSVNAPGGSYFTDIAWKKIGTWFDVTEDATINIALTFTLNGSSKRADLCLDNVKLYKWALDDQTNYDNATKSNPMDVTAKFVTNPYFDSNANGWTSTTGSQNSGRATNKTGVISGGFFENWNGSAKTSGKMYQTLSDLPDGIYRFTASAFGDQGTAALKLYAGSSYSDLITSNTPSNYSVQTTVSGGSLEIGLNVESTNEAKWLGLDNIKLEYLGFDVDAAIAAANEQATAAKSHLTDKAYTGYIDALQNAIDDIESLDGGTATKASIQTAVNNLTTALTNVSTSVSDYANLNTEIAHANAYSVVNIANASSYAAAISAAETIYSNASEESTAATILGLQNYKVEDYNYVATNYQYGVSLGEWVSSGSNDGADFNNEHWSGTTRNYKNQDDSNGRGWNSSAWDMNYNQNVTLPAGNYVFKVAGRQAQSDQVDMSLVVKKGEETLGSVNNFPHNGSSARGIDKTGAAKFAGENDDFANSGNGFGWEWRYVKFTLASDATVNIAVKVNATALHMWASFGDYTLQTDNEANISLIAYNVALNDAITARDNAAYSNVTGSEKTNLLAAIAADASLDKSKKTDIDDAKDALVAAKTAFTEAKDSYDNLVNAKANFDDEDYTQILYPYATDAKFAAIATANAMDETNATECAAKATAIYAAYRGFVESNAKAENVATATDFTSIIENANSQQGDENAIVVGQAFGWTKGTGMSRKDAEPFTDAAGVSGGHYFDYWSGSAWEKTITQSISIPAGRYILTVTSRASSNLDKFNLIVGDETPVAMKKINADVNTGTFSRGWNDNYIVFDHAGGSVAIGIDAAGNNNWMSFDRFRLTCIEAKATLTIGDAKWATFVAPFAVTIPSGVTAYTVDGVSGNAITLTPVATTIPANTPVVVNSESAVNETSYGKAVVAGTPTEGLLTGTYSQIEAPNGSYVLQKQGDVVGFYQVNTAEAQPKVPANRAYLNYSAPGVKAYFFGGETIIKNVFDGVAAGEIYDLNGTKVSKMQPGKAYIVNGATVIVK